MKGGDRWCIRRRSVPNVALKAAETVYPASGLRR
jgi:hypothetical protein